MTSINSRRSSVVALLTAPLLLLSSFASPAGAAYGGCWQGQVGLYTQANGAGHCYGFATNNTTLNGAWGQINDTIRSGKNIGTSGNSARIYKDTNYNGGVAFCIANGGQKNNAGAPQGASNTWPIAC